MSVSKKAILLVLMSNVVILFVLSLSSWYKEKSAYLKLVKKRVKSYLFQEKPAVSFFYGRVIELINVHGVTNQLFS